MEIIEATFNYLLNWISPGKPYYDNIFYAIHSLTAAVGEWIFGKTAREKQAVCEFVGFMFGLCVGYSTHTLALISFDRFLFIVKPLLYIKYMKK